MNLVENADLVRQQVETARNKANRQDQVNVIAVTKYVDAVSYTHLTLPTILLV